MPAVLPILSRKKCIFTILFFFFLCRSGSLQFGELAYCFQTKLICFQAACVVGKEKEQDLLNQRVVYLDVAVKTITERFNLLDYFGNDMMQNYELMNTVIASMANKIQKLQTISNATTQKLTMHENFLDHYEKKFEKMETANIARTQRLNEVVETTNDLKQSLENLKTYHSSSLQRIQQLERFTTEVTSQIKAIQTSKFCFFFLNTISLHWVNNTNWGYIKK